MGLISADSLNSIYDPRIAKRYTGALKNYPLTLDIALPVFTWGMHIRDNKVIALLNKVDDATFSSDIHFEMGSPSFFEVKENVIKTKSFEFAVAVTQYCRQLMERKEYVLSKQLLRSGTSIGANVREALCASSRRDFVYKLMVSLRECEETMYWLELLHACNTLEVQQYKTLHQNAKELTRILTSIINTTRDTIPSK